jgi:acyl carrier protein
MGPDEFVQRLRDRFHIAIPAEATAHDNLHDALGFDSLAVFELLFATEALAGIQVPPVDTPPIRTLNDAFEYYQLLRRAVSAAGS